MITVRQLRVEAHGSKVAMEPRLPPWLPDYVSLRHDEAPPTCWQQTSGPVRYNRVVRRSLAISLLLMFSLPLIAPLFALQLANGQLPACCRRNGAHHCSMQISSESRGMRFEAIRSKCPAYPKAITSLKRNELSLQATALLLSVAPVRPAGDIRTKAHVRMTLYRSEQERGPPTSRT